MEECLKTLELQLDGKDKEVEDLQNKLSKVSYFYFYVIIISLSLLESLDYFICSTTTPLNTLGSSLREDP